MDYYTAFECLLIAIIFGLFLTTFVLNDFLGSKSEAVAKSLVLGFIGALVLHCVIIFRDDIIDDRIRQVATVEDLTGMVYKLDKVAGRKYTKDKYYCVLAIEDELCQFEVTVELYRKVKEGETIPYRLYVYDDEIYDIELLYNDTVFHCIEKIPYRDTKFKSWRIE